MGEAAQRRRGPVQRHQDGLQVPRRQPGQARPQNAAHGRPGSNVHT